MNTSPYATYPPMMLHEAKEEELHEPKCQTFMALGETIISKVGSPSNIGSIEVKVTTKDEVMDSHEICAYLKITPKQLYSLRRNKGLPSYKPSGKTLRFYRSEVDDWLVSRGL